MAYKSYEDKLKYAREFKRNNPEKAKEYRNTIPSLICRIYNRMQSRVNGKACKSPYLYKGLAICTKEEFNKLAYTSHEFKMLYIAWKDNEWNIRLTPSVNRINPELGYTIENIEFITFSKNCSQTRKNGYVSKTQTRTA